MVELFDNSFRKALVERVGELLCYRCSLFSVVVDDNKYFAGNRDLWVRLALMLLSDVSSADPRGIPH
jgi:hypothetical protein